MNSVDARGLECPMPLAMAKARLAELVPGEELVVLATDPEAPIDIGGWAADQGHAFEERPREGWTELIVRKHQAAGRQG